MIFYGWGKDLRQIAYAGIEKCQNCRNHSHFWICESASYAELYFIKLAKWNKKSFLMCETCQRGVELAQSKINEIISTTIALPSYDSVCEMWKQLDSNVSESASGLTDGHEIMEAIQASIAKSSTQLRERIDPGHVDYVVSRFVRFLSDTDVPA